MSSFPANFAYTFDAWLHLDGISADFSREAGVFQFAVNITLMLLLVIPLRKYGSKLIDMIKTPNVWISIILVSVIFILLNISMIPHNYYTLYVERCFPVYIMILSVLFILLLFMYVTLYCIAMSVQKNADLSERIRFFEIQESQYIIQKKYIEETSKQRHDFRHSIFTINNLAESDDLNSLKEYLAKYMEMLPKTETITYCKNSTVNALLNYYAQSATENSICIEWNIGFPDNLTISEPDICSLMGNMIENAISGCMTLSDEKDRYHYLSVTVKNDVNLCIVSTNSFNSVVRMKE
ncbi:MAG: GHKL domain-containing protein [Ruminococcus sp.]|nr:GHKL domain-containing protein [Ruminococcus sp.]MDE6849383.1 GHKL domain-containing protein [Ruminococcus sp.]MDE7138996.1 GHKL domain-containing protein [Ruminococcus sp.]